MRLHISVPNKKSVMVNLGHSKLWVESGMVAKLKVKYMEVSLKDGTFWCGLQQVLVKAVV